MKLTEAQFRAAHALALAHGHLWASACAEDSYAECCPVWAAAQRRVAAEVAAGSVSLEAIRAVALLRDSSGPGGICAPRVDAQGRVVHHTSDGAGRARWSVAPSGATDIEITRPLTAERARRTELARLASLTEMILVYSAHGTPNWTLPEEATAPLRRQWRTWIRAERDAAGAWLVGREERTPFVEAAAASRVVLHIAAEKRIARLRARMPIDYTVVLRASVAPDGTCVVERRGDARARHVEALADCLRALKIEDDDCLAAARRACPDAAEAALDYNVCAEAFEHESNEREASIAHRRARLWREAA